MFEKACYHFITFFFCVLFRLFYRVSYSGLENIPLDGKAILAANHHSFYDAPFVYYVTLITGRRKYSEGAKYHAVTHKSLFKVWWIRIFLHAFGSIPTNGSTEAVIQTLQADKMILIFPEGGCQCCHKQIFSEKAHTGVAIFALTTGSPVIPIAIKGTLEALPIRKRIIRFFRPLALHAGTPLEFEKVASADLTEERIKETLAVILEAIKKAYDSANA
jgi:1-acyl-sn-glycerol-3-phosphate acyltransferase